MEPILDLLGIRQIPGTLSRLSSEVAPHVMLAKTTSQACELSYILAGTSGMYYVAMESVAALDVVEDKGYDIIPMLTCDSTWNELQTRNFKDSIPEYQPVTGEHLGNYNAMLSLRRLVGEKEQRIIISGDSDFLSNGGIGTTYNLKIAPVNYEYLMGMFNWLSYGDLPVDIRRPAPVDNRFFVSSGTAEVLKIVLVWGFSLALLAVACILSIRRRGR